MEKGGRRVVMFFLVMHLVACDHRLLSDEAADDVEGENVTGVMDGEGRKKGGDVIFSHASGSVRSQAVI